MLVRATIFCILKYLENSSKRVTQKAKHQLINTLRAHILEVIFSQDLSVEEVSLIRDSAFYEELVSAIKHSVTVDLYRS